MADPPAWLTREAIQLTLVILAAMVFHYYFIKQRMEAGGSFFSSSFPASIGQDGDTDFDRRQEEAMLG